MDRLGIWYNWPYGPEVVDSFDMELMQEEFLEFGSINHRRLRGGGWSGGGPFLSKKRFTRYTPSNSVHVSVAGKPMYDGALIANPPVDLPQLVPHAELEGLGATAYARAAPDRPIMDAANALYELKDVPSMLRQAYNAVRSLPRLGSIRLRDVSDFNLAVAFGWLPLLSDTVKLYNSQKEIRSKLAQLKRDNGRPIRRKFQLKDQNVNSSSIVDRGTEQYGTTHMGPWFLTGTYGGGEWELSHHATTRVWFSGQFRYWLPDQGQMSDNEWDRKLIGRLFGFKPTPSRIYQAMPWSWLIDWFSNTGDIIANLDASVADRLINDYAYLMRHHEVFARIKSSHKIWSGETWQNAVAVTERGTMVSQRVPASPFGFGVKTPDLSPYQLTILGSLAGKR
jgi:hypothetical protein